MTVLNFALAPQILPSFETAWGLYPRKRGRAAALRHFRGNFRTPQSFAALLSAIRNYKEEIYLLGTADQHVMYGSTFFHEGWQDFEDGTWEPPKVKANPNCCNCTDRMDGMACARHSRGPQ